ncbi:MAG: sigma 54-dependent transcriptional regulator, partial [Myxococcales bacterium]|nr:sigma 54-dependent transcriptional regulator [Myxococcales bacterium]
VSSGKFREDLLARINLWTFALPGLRERAEDIEPNLDYELEQHAARAGRKVSMNRDARAAFLRFATSSAAAWTANFRDLAAAVERMATLAPGGRINEALVREEIGRLERSWAPAAARDDDDDAVLARHLPREQVEGLDRFDKVQLADVLRVCERARSLSDAGRALFAASRDRRKVKNDADRLRKYLAKFELEWRQIAP